MNQTDNEQTVAAISDAAQRILDRYDAGPWRVLSRKVARLLLSLAGTRAAEARAAELAAPGTGEWSYKEGYLKDPAHSFAFNLERRHVADVLARSDVDVASRLRRIRHHLPDPSISLTEDCLRHLAGVAAEFDVTKLDLHRGHTQEDHVAENLVVDLARFSPSGFAALTRRRLRELSHRNDEALHWASVRSSEYLLICSDEERGHARQARTNPCQLPAPDKLWRTCCLLMLDFCIEAAKNSCEFCATPNWTNIRRY